MSIADLAYCMTANTVMRRSSTTVKEYLNGCQCKRRYDSRQHAANSRFASKAYRCRFCGGWHATSQDR
jgi:predicted SprT family Zn-dependent metalloprotease